MARGFWRLLVIIGIALLGSLLLERGLNSHYVLELYLLLLGVIISIIVLMGVAWGKRWGWPLAAVFLSLLTLNAMVVYLSIRAAFLTFEIVIALCLMGLVMAFLRATQPEPVGDPLATLPKMEFKAPKKKGRKK